MLRLGLHTLTPQVVIMPIWTYEIQLWSSACTFNIALLHSRILRMSGVPWYLTILKIIFGATIQLDQVLEVC